MFTYMEQVNDHKLMMNAMRYNEYDSIYNNYDNPVNNVNNVNNKLTIVPNKYKINNKFIAIAIIISFICKFVFKN